MHSAEREAQKTEIRAQKTEDGGQAVVARSTRSRRSEGRGRRSEGRRQRAEGQGAWRKEQSGKHRILIPRPEFPFNHLQVSFCLLGEEEHPGLWSPVALRLLHGTEPV